MPESSPGQSSSIASTDTCLFKESWRKKKRKKKGEIGGEPPEIPCTGHQMLRHSKRGLEKNFQTEHFRRE